MIKTIPQDSISVNSYIVKTHKRLQSVDAESADYYLNNSCRMRGQAATGTFSEVLDELDVESGKYKRIVYASIKRQYYSAPGPLSIGTESDFTKESRVLGNSFTAIKLTSSYFGDKISPNTVHISDYSSQFDDAYNIEDDGFTNLFISGNFFSAYNALKAKNSQPSQSTWDMTTGKFYVIDGGIKKYISPEDAPILRDAGWDVTYENGSATMTYDTSVERFHFEVENTAFGSAIATNNKYIAVGAPYQYGNRNAGYATLFKYDENAGCHKSIKRVIPRNIQNAFAVEDPHDASVFITLERGNYIETEECPNISSSFGYSVGLSNEYFTVGSPDFSLTGTGSVYVYKKMKGGIDNWGQYNIITTKTPGDLFGYAIAQSDTSIIVSAPKANRVYVFETASMSTTTEYTSTVTGSDYDSFVLKDVLVGGDGFGISVSMCGDILAIGETNAPEFQSGKVNIYTYVSGSWELNQVIYADKSNTGDLSAKEKEYYVPSEYNGFGYRVSVVQNALAISAVNEYVDIQGDHGLSPVYLYNRTEESACVSGTKQFSCTAKIFENSIVSGKHFFHGASISISSDKLAIGSIASRSLMTATADGLINTISSGSIGDYTGYVTVYDFDEASATINTSIKTKVSSTDISRYYGKAVNITDDFLVVGAPVEFVYSNTNSYENINDFVYTTEHNFPKIWQTGSVYVYDFDNIKSNPKVGNVFYKTGLIVATATESLFSGILNGNDSLGFDATFDVEHTLNEKEIVVTINPGEFNGSMNPLAQQVVGIPYDILSSGSVSEQDVLLIAKFLKNKSDKSDVYYDNGINLEVDGFTDDSWVKNQITLLETGDVMLLENENATSPSTLDAFLTINSEIYNKLAQIDLTGAFDIDGDGKSTVYDGLILMSYYYGKLTPDRLRSLINLQTATRTTVQEITEFILMNMGIGKKLLNKHFFTYTSQSYSDLTGSYLSPCVTSVGLYSGNELVAVAKLGQPIKTSTNVPINISIKIDM